MRITAWIWYRNSASKGWNWDKQERFAGLERRNVSYHVFGRTQQQVLCPVVNRVTKRQCGTVQMEPSHIAFITVYPCLLPLYRCGGCPEFFYSICQTLAVQVTVQVLLHNGTELGVVIIRIIVIVRNELSVIVKACLESRDGFIKECCTFLYGKTGAECGMILYIGEEAGMLPAEGDQPVRDSPAAADRDHT